MLEDSEGKPVIGDKKFMLGVRVGPVPSGDISINSDGMVYPGGGGLSVVPDWKVLPHFLIPRRLQQLAPRATGKNDGSRSFRRGSGPFESGIFGNGLTLRVETDIHGLVEPESRMVLEDFQSYLASTRDEWLIDES
jgi:hypothetical protein